MATTTPVPAMPGKLPLVGHAPQMMRNGPDFMDAARQLGPIVLVHLGRKPAYLVNDPALLRQVLVTDSARFDGKGELSEKAAPILGNGLSCSNGAFHLRQRRLMQPAFHRERLASYSQVMCELAVAKMAPWTEGQQLKIDEETRGLALEVAARTLFSAEIGQQAVKEFQRSMPIVIAGTAVRAMLPLMAKLPTPANRRYNTALTLLHQVIDDVISAYRSDGTDHQDLLSMLLAARDEETGESMSDKQVHDEVITITFGGTETTAGGLAWSFHELARHPELETRVHAELDEVLAGRPIEFEDIAKLEYLRRFASEVLRLHAPWLLTRAATEDAQLGSVHIAKDSAILYSPHAVHHDPRFYPEPTKLDPDRWLSDRAADLPRGTFLPFGEGKHRCIGEHFAWTELMVVLATVCARWRLRSVPGHTVKPVTAKAGGPNSLPMTVETR